MLLNKKIATALTGFVLLAGMGISAKATFAQTTPNPMPPTHTIAHEKHPELRAALRSLKVARMDLQKGSHDFQGERVEALKDTDKAISEIEQALKSDRH
ncbi:hypothetical protein [Phormidesmis priestleyi]|uniref:hypothetical protein n=1 Tax=Phormidesmis priestleyi TaxID=268141 RepID=UPI00083B374D|nr:hypothetical protein [Phormidesmis priestleyi]